MTRLTIRTPSRLHFGLLSWGQKSARQFGGVGLMVDGPGLTIAAEPASAWQARGALASRILGFAGRAAEGLAARGIEARPMAFDVVEAPPEHVGLGVGTQLGLAVASLVARMAGLSDPAFADLVEFSGRGLRSGIGLHGFQLGGLVVDGGRTADSAIPPLLARLDFPGDWSILVVIPDREPSLHGPGEIRAFADLPPSPDALTDRLCRLVLLGLLPAVIERNLPDFGEALAEIQHRVGQGFSPAQGGLYARPGLETMVAHLRSEGLHGVGQSSWGPTLYAFSDFPEGRRVEILDRFHHRFGLGHGAAFWTRASIAGASIRVG